MERDLGAIEHREQLILVGVQPLQQPVEGGKAGAPAEDAVV
jgi:hypothetical protein